MLEKIGDVNVWAADARRSGALKQALRLAEVPGVAAPVALMPDAHVGIGACIGSVVATEKAIIPAAVGVDIGCGVSAAELELRAEELPADLSGVLEAFAPAVPITHHPAGGDGGRAAAARWMAGRPPPSMLDAGRAAAQLGTLGGGNHFLEMSVDDVRGGVWLVVHSGSRGAGNFIARHHMKTASGLDGRAVEENLATLREGSLEFDSYVSDMLWASDYARRNRELMLEAAEDALQKAAGLRRKRRRVISCHHNYAQQERFGGRRLWITRKGAISARPGELGVIPGSMGTSTFVVEGLGSAAAWCSAAHGAGREMSRSQARKLLTADGLRQTMESRPRAAGSPRPVWQAGRAEKLVDEAPAAYKDIRAVMEAQADLCRPILRLEAVVNYKG